MFRLASDMQDKHDMPLITADDTVAFFFLDAQASLAPTHVCL